MPKILILGEGGQLARALSELAWPGGGVTTALGRRQLGDAAVAAAAAATAIRDLRPELVLNAAAYTAVDRAETEPDLARALNADLPTAVARACAALDIPLVHVSTDYVFDGEKAGAYLETDSPNPLSVYGATKLAGDRGIESAAERWAILRTSWVFSAAATAFPGRLLARAAAGEVLHVVDDQRGCPTPVRALAGAMQAVGLRLLDRDEAARGLFNFCGAHAMSRHAFAALLAETAVAMGMPQPDLRAVASDGFPAAAQRPRNSVLDCGLIVERCGVERPDVATDIADVVREILRR